MVDIIKTLNMIFKIWETKISKFYGEHRKAHNPIYNDDTIYSPSVDVFKTDTVEPVLMDDKDWFKVDVLTCA